MAIENYLVKWRNGTIDDPYVPIVETLTILNDRLVLKEIPDEFNGIQINGYFYTDGLIESSKQFRVDWVTGFVYFNPTENGKSVTVNYMGRGYILFAANRIYVNMQNSDLAQNLQDILDNSKNGIDALSQIEQATIDAQTATINANTARNNAQAEADNLHSIWKGFYNATSTYVVNSLVGFQGDTYICKQNTTAGIDPTNTAYWDLVASKGTMTDTIVDNSISVRNADGTSKYIIQFNSSGLQFILS